MKAGDKKKGKDAPKGASKPAVRAPRKDVSEYENREMKPGMARSGGYRIK